MLKDFTLSTYKQLLQAFKENNYKFLTLEEYFNYISLPNHSVVILRHDVDRNPKNALKTAIIENKLGIKASYYFRIGKQSNQP